MTSVERSAKKPRGSVVIPCLNYAVYLRNRLHSVLNQSFHDFEAIVIDDASTDHTPEVVHLRQKKYQEPLSINAERSLSC